MSDLTVTLNYTEIASAVMALRNHSKRTIEVCDKIIETLDKAKVDNDRGNITVDSTN